MEIDGKNYPINTGHRAALRVLAAWEDELADYEKCLILLANIYKRIPENTEEAIKRAIWYLDGGAEAKENSGPRLCSFAKDANYIYAAFRQTHNIDLEEKELHWWKFLALFLDLGSDTAFCNLVGLRKLDAEGKTTPEQKATIQSLGDIFEIPQPDTRTEDEKKADELFEAALKQAQQRKRG